MKAPTEGPARRHVCFPPQDWTTWLLVLFILPTHSPSRLSTVSLSPSLPLVRPSSPGHFNDFQLLPLHKQHYRTTTAICLKCSSSLENRLITMQSRSLFVSPLLPCRLGAAWEQGEFWLNSAHAAPDIYGNTLLAVPYTSLLPEKKAVGV